MAGEDKQKDYEDTMRFRRGVRRGVGGKPNGFEQGREIDVEEGMKGLREAENEMKRESSRGGEAAKRDTSMRGKIREMIGMKKGGAVKSASSRADGCAVRGKTRGKIV